jgi:AAA domain (dynein-related subfamily)
MNSIDIRKQNFLIALAALYGYANSISDAIYSREQCIAAIAYCKDKGKETYSVLPAWLTQDKSRRASRGMYTIPEMVTAEIEQNVSESCDSELATSETSDTITTMNSSTFNLVAPSSDVSLVPVKNDTFVPWGHHDDISTILKSKQFAPVYITGMSGNGKTTMVEQICAASGRECIRVNITAETDEDDLIGGFRLINGETKFVFGGVVQAMQRGAILLLDEIDLGTERMMCLQPVLEGKGIYIKKIGVFVKPAPGFNVVATANTKGKGESDRFVGTRCMNEAFLDRFSYWFEQDYADKTVEARIIIRKMKAYGKEDKEFAGFLVKWAETIRLGFKEGGLDDIITTRRLEEVCKAFAIFGDKQKAIRLTLTRFDTATQEAFFNLYTKIDPTILPAPDGMKEAEAKQGIAPPAVDKVLMDEIDRALAAINPNNTVVSPVSTTYAVNA